MRKLTDRIVAFIFGAAISFSALSCSDLKSLESDVADLKDQLAELRGQCASMNESIDALSVVVDALSKSDYVTSVQNISNSEGQGFVITFVNSPTVAVWIPSQNASTPGDSATNAPVISIKIGEDGVYYWASDGDYVLDQNGQRVPVSADGVTPELKIEDGKWYVSYDGGATWTYLADVPAQGADGYVFTGVDLSDPSKVVLTLVDGQTITLPVVMDGLLSLNVASGTSHVAGDVVTISYSALKKVSVIVDDADVQYSEISASDDMNGEIRIQTYSDVALMNQRAFLIFTIDGYLDQDWRLLSFDSAGNAIISDIK